MAWPRRSKISYWEGFVGLWQSPFGKLCDKMLAVSWGGAEGGWRALIRAGESTMLFVIGRVDLLDGVTTALEGASTSWLLGLSAGGFMLPTCFGDDGLSLLFFPSWQWIFSFVPKSKNTHTHTHLRWFCLVPLWLATWLRSEIFLAEREQNQIKGTD